MRGLLISLLSIFFSFSIAAESFYVMPVKARRVDKDISATIKDLIETALGEEGHQVSNSQAEADGLMKATISRLGNSYTVSLRLIRNSKVKYNSKLKANGEDELDTVVTRLVRGAVKGKQAKSTKRIGEITDNEVTEVSKRTESRHYTYFGLGPYGLSKMGTPGVGYYAAYGHIWEVTPNSGIKLMGEGSFLSNDETASIVSLSGGANYYFSADTTSFFVGADLGYGGAATTAKGIDSVAGFALGASVGVTFFRTSATQMSLTARIQGIMADNNEGNPYHGGLILGFHY